MRGGLASSVLLPFLKAKKSAAAKRLPGFTG
jgi:hypothetical protein